MFFEAPKIYFISIFVQMTLIVYFHVFRKSTRDTSIIKCIIIDHNIEYNTEKFGENLTIINKDTVRQICLSFS